MNLQGYQRSHLSRLAHHLEPVVLIGAAGASPGVVKALNEALDHHELIKIKFLDHKDAKTGVARGLSEELHAILVRITGNTAVFYRQARKPENRRIEIPQRGKGV